MKRIGICVALGMTLACGHRGPETIAESAGTPLAIQPAAALLDEALPAYRPLPSVPITGPLVSVGSDSMEPLMLGWKDEFKVMHPGIRFDIECKGSATAPVALAEGRSLMGQMSREMNSDELAKFEAAFGYQPTRIVVAADAIAVYVNANNPVPRLTLQEVDAIYSTTRKGGHAELDSWGGLGLSGIWKDRAIQPYGRDEKSGTRAFFLERVMKKGAFKPLVKALPDQFAAMEAVAIDAAGISYGPFQHSIRMVRSVPLVDGKGGAPIAATVESVLTGKYPLTRFLYIYVNHKPGTPMDPLLKGFLTFILSRDGQKSVAEFGAVPLPADLAEMNRSKLN